MFQELHQSVLLHEAVTALSVDPDGQYLDGTFGRGGHSRAILSQLSAAGRLYVIDCDPEALAFARDLAAEDSRVTVLAGDFETVVNQLAEEAKQFDGVLFDFGVSSPQLDDAHRGFSFQQDGPLDMRMDCESGQSAAEWLNTASAEEMKKVFWRYGEEKRAGRIARAVVETREEKPLTTTKDLVNVIVQVNKPHPKDKKHPATRVFQAVRIHVNDELGQIERMLPQSLKLLKSGSRLVVISFHSLEDRLVKRFMRDMSKPEAVDRRMPVLPDHLRPALLKLIGKPVKAVDVDANVRARSAIMRTAELL